MWRRTDHIQMVYKNCPRVAVATTMVTAIVAPVPELNPPLEGADGASDGVAVGTERGPTQVVSQGRIHSFSGSHHTYPAEGMQPCSSLSLPGMVGLATGRNDGRAVGDAVGDGEVITFTQDVSQGRIHSSNGSHQTYPAEGMQPCSSRSLPGMIRAVGFLVGELVGLLVGFLVGELVGLLVGFLVGERVGLLVGFLVGERVGLLVGFLVGDGVGSGQSVSQDRMHLLRDGHQDSPAEGMHPCLSRSLPGEGQSVSQDRMHSLREGHQDSPAEGIHPCSSRSLPGAGLVGDGVGFGQSVSQDRMHSLRDGHQDSPAEGMQPCLSRSLPGEGQSVSQDRMHSLRDGHQDSPAEGMQPCSSRSLPGSIGEEVGESVGGTGVGESVRGGGVGESVGGGGVGESVGEGQSVSHDRMHLSRDSQ